MANPAYNISYEALGLRNRAGLTPLAVDPKTKKPLYKWAEFQGRRPSTLEIQEQFHSATGLALITGKISSNLEALDFDNRGELYQKWKEGVKRRAPGLFEKLVVEKSQSSGFHVLCRCSGVVIPGSQKLAQRAIDVTEQTLTALKKSKVDQADPKAIRAFLPKIRIEINGKGYAPIPRKDKFIGLMTLIETRGEGGYIVVAPTPGYALIQGNFYSIPTITPEERQILIDTAEALNEFADLSDAEGIGYRLPKDARRPGDDFNERGDILPFLKEVGCKLCGERGAYQHLTRPGKDDGISASLIGGAVLKVFSTNFYPFEGGKKYAPFAVFAHLECDGDFVKAAGELAKLGYGNGYQPASAVTATMSEKTFLPVPPTFPVEVFPVSCQVAITEIQKAHGVPIEIPGCAFLGTAGACIGRARGLRIKQGWVEHGNLWLAIVAPSGYGKSPAVREIQRPVFTLEKRWFAEYQEALNQFNLELEQRRLIPKDERSSLPTPPTPPGWQQLIVDDTTTEALTDALDANPRGILWNRDELSGLLHDLDKYAKKEGGSKARMMSSYDSGPWKVNRREASKRAFIPHATLSIFGTIQPKALPTIFSDLDAATGFLPRFIFVNPTWETPPLWTDETVSTTARDYLASIFERLLALDLDEQEEPCIISIEWEAKCLYENWFNEQVLEPWQKVEVSIYEAVLAKLRGQCLRFALILHCLEAADAGRPDTSPVSPETMEKAITLANCFKAHQRNAWQFIVNQDRVAELPPLHRQVARAILSLEQEIVGGMLATARIAGRVNQGLDPRFHVSVSAVGKTAAVLKLTTDRLPNRLVRGFRIKSEDLQRLHSYFPSEISVPCVPSVRDLETTGLSSENSSVLETSQVSGGDSFSGHLGHLPDTCQILEKVHEQSVSDTSDTSDASFHNEDEILAGGVL